jgi:uncharacterized protein YecE (DUF72 family)
MRLRVGLTQVSGSIEEYAKRFDLLELRADPKRLPSVKALRRMRGVAGESVAFSLLVPSELSARALENADEIAATLTTAQSIEPGWMVIQTGATVGPSQRTRARLEALVARMKHGERRIAWEPRGPFEPEVALEWSQSLGITLVEDLSRADGEPGETVYTRLRAEGPGARLSTGALERLAEQVAESNEVWVVIEGKPSPKARARVRQIVEQQVELVREAGENGEEFEDDEEDLDDEDLDDEDLDDDSDADGDDEDGEESAR